MAAQLSPKFESYQTSIILKGESIGSLEVEIEESNVQSSKDVGISYTVTGSLTFRNKIGRVDHEFVVVGKHTTGTFTTGTIKSKMLIRFPKNKIDANNTLTYVKYWNLTLKDLTNGIEVPLNNIEHYFASPSVEQKFGESKRSGPFAGAPISSTNGPTLSKPAIVVPAKTVTSTPTPTPAKTVTSTPVKISSVPAKTITSAPTKTITSNPVKINSVPAKTITSAPNHTPNKSSSTTTPVSDQDATITIDVPDAGDVARIVLNVHNMSKVKEIVLRPVDNS